VLNNDIESLFASAVKRATEITRAEGAAGCAAPGIITAYHEHTLSESEHMRWQAHFAGCYRCRSALAEVASVPSPDVVTLPAAVPDSPPSSPSFDTRRSRLLPIAVLAAAVMTFSVAVTAEMSPPVGDVVHRAVHMSALRLTEALERAGVASGLSIRTQTSTFAASKTPERAAAAASENSKSATAAPALSAQPSSTSARTLKPQEPAKAVSTMKIVIETKPSVAALAPQQQIVVAQENKDVLPPAAVHPSYLAPRQTTVSAPIEAAPIDSRRSKLPARPMLTQESEQSRQSAPPRHSHPSAVALHTADDEAQHSLRGSVAGPAPIVVASTGQATTSISVGPAASKRTSKVSSPPQVAAIFAPHPQRIDAPTVRAPQDASLAIAAGTRITIANWRQYKAFMPDGMIALFSGRYALKMPPDVEIDIGPPRHVVAPSTFRQATEEHSGQVRVVHLPDGHNDLANYVAGEPFPNPGGPDKGYEILVDLWYTYSPHLAVGMPGWGLWDVRMLDRFGNSTSAKWAFVYRQVAFNTDPGVATTDPLAAGAFYTQWLMTDEPEQAKYTTDLDILPQDNQRDEVNYLFFPALRRSARFSVGARCAPLLGTDWTHDDQKPGFNGGLASFDATYLRDMKMLALVDLGAAVAAFPSEYDMPLGFARPSWGRWSQRDAWVIDIHRIPSESLGYCYSKRIEYVDKETTRGLWEDLYDSAGKLWKVTMNAYYPRRVPGTDGETIYGRFAASTWDLQNQHATLGNSTDATGRLITFNSEVPSQFDDVAKFSTPGGLMQIMR
jgi:Protein of unknown function (DUF1329)